MIIGLFGEDGVGKDTVARFMRLVIYNYPASIYEGALSWGEDTFEYWMSDKNHKEEMDILMLGRKGGMGWLEHKFASIPVGLYHSITGVKFHELSRKDKEKEQPRFVNFCETQKEIFGQNVWVDALMRDYNPNMGIVRSYGLDIGGDEVYVDMSNKYHRELIRAKDMLNKSKKIEKDWIITDVRFGAEIEAIKKRGGLVFKVVRKNKGDYYESQLPSNFEFDAIVDNRGHIFDTIKQIEGLVKEFELYKI